MLNGRYPRIDLTHIGLALVGLMWVLPFLHDRHQYPLTTFDQEWWAALLGVMACALLLAPGYWRAPQIPRIVQLPAALICLVVLQTSMGMMPYLEQSLLYLLYLAFALLLMMLGARLRDCIGLEKMAAMLAIFLLAGAELNAMIGILQYYHWHTPFDSVVVAKMGDGVYGNLAQRNHFADYIALGLISLGLLFHRRKLPKGMVVALAIPLLFVLMLSGSRSSWLYLLLMTLLAFGRNMRSMLYYCMLLLAGFALMHGVVQLPFMKGEGYDVMHRMLEEPQSGYIRLYLWHEAWLMFRHSPWLGSGFGQFAWQHFLLGKQLHRTELVGLYNNAHNLIFQIAVETGVAGLMALLAPLAIWLHGLRGTKMSAEHWWGCALLGVLATHSMLEYPLWYAYFLGVAAILLGMMDQTRYSLTLRNAGRMSVAAMLVLGFLSLAQLKVGYGRLKDTLAVHPASGEVAAALARIEDGLAAVRGTILLRPYADLYTSVSSEVNAERMDAKLAQGDKVMRFIPAGQIVYRQAFLLAGNGQADQARRLLELAIWSYPDDPEVHQKLAGLAQKDPAHYAALLEFALQIEQEYVSAIHNE